MNKWEHLSQVPDEVRHTMSAKFVEWDKQDLGIEAHVDGTIQSEPVTHAVVKALHQAANGVRIPPLIDAVRSRHPLLSLRDSFKAVALFIGLHEKNVQKAYYKRERCSK